MYKRWRGAMGMYDGEVWWICAMENVVAMSNGENLQQSTQLETRLNGPSLENRFT